MSTNALIGRYDNDTGKIHYVYLHWDGYPDAVWPTLTRHYNTDEAVIRLLEDGSISCLDKDIENCVYYHRDKKENPIYNLTKVVTVDEFISMNSTSSNIEYIYLFDKEDGWSCYSGTMKEINREDLNKELV